MTVDHRLQLFNTLAALPTPAFNKLLFAIKPPDGVVAGSTAPQGDRTAQLVQWAESSPRHGLAFIQDVLNRLDSFSDPPESPSQIQDVEALVATIRAQVHGDIQARCGTMRVLDMEQPIELGDIYTRVNILERLSGRQRLDLDDLLQDVEPENFDRFMLGQVRQQRVPGIEAVERYDKLMVLGKPGAGKTTFLKRLATLCNLGKFEHQRVPVFVTLKDYAETPGKPNLQIYMQTQWQACGVREADAVTTVLTQGKALILLDGLDEVQEADHDRILHDIKAFAQQFRACRCVITCRIAAREYTFEQFTEVEVADFDPEQIAEFAAKWFAAKQNPDKSRTFLKQLDGNKRIQELATTPILLILLCLISDETGKFPRNRAEVYKEGIDLLLKKWDEKRNIKRAQIYKKLSPQDKKNLLSQFAFETFEQGSYFFRQSVVEHHLTQNMSSLTGASEDEEALYLDGESLLKSIEAQHGLLVERARGIYSFSHLTFQEYFTARHIISPTIKLNLALQNLVTHITEKRYREIFLLVAGMLPEADILLLRMKHQIDQLMIDYFPEKPRLQGVLRLLCKYRFWQREIKTSRLSKQNCPNTPNLQAALAWVQQKSTSVDTSYKPAAVRALYYELARGLDLANILHIARGFATTIANDFDLEIAFDFSFTNDFTRDHALVRTLDQALTHDHTHALDRALAFTLAFALDHALDRDYDLARVLDLALTRVLDHNHDLVAGPAGQSDPDLKLRLQTLKAELPSQDDFEEFKLWWQQNGKIWAEKLRSAMIEHRNIGHDWQFSEVQKEKLKQYYDANKLLVDCLSSDCYVTKATRQYIENTLLLPLSEIEKYPVPDAIANL